MPWTSVMVALAEKSNHTENQMVAYYSKVVPITPADRRSPGDFCFRE